MTQQKDYQQSQRRSWDAQAQEPQSKRAKCVALNIDLFLSRETLYQHHVIIVGQKVVWEGFELCRPVAVL